LWQASIRVADSRPQIPRETPDTPPFNIWSTNVPGSTYCVLVSEPTTLALTVLFLILGEDMGFYLFDDHNGYRPAGLKPFAKSKGGHLHDDPIDTYNFPSGPTLIVRDTWTDGVELGRSANFSGWPTGLPFDQRTRITAGVVAM